VAFAVVRNSAPAVTRQFQGLDRPARSYVPLRFARGSPTTRRVDFPWMDSLAGWDLLDL
jgi:hypothetical protein